MSQREFHPLELAMPAVFLIVVYYALFSTFTPFFSKNQSVRSIYERAQLLMRRGNFSQALIYVEELNRQFPANHVYWMLRADLDRRLSQPVDEARALEQVMVHSSTPDDACPRVAEAYRAAGQGERSLDAYRRCLKLDPNNSDFHLFLGLAEERAGDREASLPEFEACLARSPQYLDCSTGLARIYLHRNEPKKVLAILKSDKVDGDAEALIIRAQARKAMGFRRLARSDYRRLVELDPKAADAWMELGALEKELGNKDAATEAFQRGNNLKSPSGTRLGDAK
jgi:tetratricopeptide (TPR) repeat protein